jgi:hypothetical protein
MLARTFLLCAIVVMVNALTDAGLAQTTGDLDGPSFVDTALKAISSSPASDRRAARNTVANQVGFLPAELRNSVTNTLISKLKSDELNPNGDVLGILANTPVTWSTQNTKEDMLYLYGVLSNSTDETTKTLADLALANAKGSYKDGIAHFNSTDLHDLNAAGPPLTYVAQTFPKSRYAERAGFYLGQLYSKEYLLQDSRDPQLLVNSNKALENYISRAERGEFAKTDFLAAGYFNRGLNAWLAGNSDDALLWMNKGKSKFSNTDQIYVYQLFVSKDKALIIDKWLPAQSAFSTAADFLNRTPHPTPESTTELTTDLRSLAN